MKYLQKLRHHKVRFAFSSLSSSSTNPSPDFISASAKSLNSVKKSYSPKYPFLPNKLYYLDGQVEEVKREDDYLHDEEEQEKKENEENEEKVEVEKNEGEEDLEAEPVHEEESVVLPDKLTEQEKKDFYVDNETEDEEEESEEESSVSLSTIFSINIFSLIFLSHIF